MQTRTTQRPGRWVLSANERPVLVEHALEPARYGARRAHGHLEGGTGIIGADDVHEQAIAHVVHIVDRSMEDRIVENEKRIVDPVVHSPIDLDENVPAVDRIEIVEHAEGAPERTEMPGCSLARVEHPHPALLDLAPHTPTTRAA